MSIPEFLRLIQKLVIKIWNKQCGQDPVEKGKLFLLKDLIVHKAVEREEVMLSALEDELEPPSLDVNFGFSGAVYVYAIMSTVEDELLAWEPRKKNRPSRLLSIRKHSARITGDKIMNSGAKS